MCRTVCCNGENSDGSLLWTHIGITSNYDKAYFLPPEVVNAAQALDTDAVMSLSTLARSLETIHDWLEHLLVASQLL